MHRRMALSTVFALVFSACASAQSSIAPSLQEILDKVGETYGSLSSVQVENKIIVEETEKGAAPVKIADVTIIAASKGLVTKGRSLPSSIFVIDITAGGVRILHGFDGTSAWFYSSKTQEYTTGPTPHSVVSSVSGSMMLSIAFASLIGIDPQLWTSMRLAGSEIIQINGEKRDCHVIEGRIKPYVRPDMSIGASPSSNATVSTMHVLLRPSGFATGLASQSLTLGPTYIYPTLTPPSQRPVSPHIRLWVDKERYLVLRSTVDEPALRVSPPPISTKGGQPRDAKYVDLRLIDTFTLVRIGDDVPSTLFHFEPPSGATERRR